MHHFYQDRLGTNISGKVEQTMSPQADMASLGADAAQLAHSAQVSVTTIDQAADLFSGTIDMI